MVRQNRVDTTSKIRDGMQVFPFNVKISQNVKMRYACYNASRLQGYSYFMAESLQEAYAHIWGKWLNNKSRIKSATSCAGRTKKVKVKE